MLELMNKINNLKLIISSFELRELSNPLKSHDFEIYKGYKKELEQLEKKLDEIALIEKKTKKSEPMPEKYDLTGVDFTKMSDKEKKYLFC